MAEKQRHPRGNAPDPQHEDDKQRPTHYGVDGVGGAGGSSGTGGLRTAPAYVGEISGIDAEIESDEIPMPGSTGKAGPTNARQGHTENSMNGKNRGPASETEPSRSLGNGDND